MPHLLQLARQVATRGTLAITSSCLHNGMCTLCEWQTLGVWSYGTQLVTQIHVVKI